MRQKQKHLRLPYIRKIQNKENLINSILKLEFFSKLGKDYDIPFQ